MILYLHWYKSDKLKQPYIQTIFSLSFYIFLVMFREWHRGSGIVKLTKCDKVEQGEKFHYASNILFWMALFSICYFIVILLRESDFLSEILP